MIVFTKITSNTIDEIGTETFIVKDYRNIPLNTNMEPEDNFLMYHISAPIKQFNRSITNSIHDTLIAIIGQIYSL